jgi:S-adenosylmethionine synthetase
VSQELVVVSGEKNTNTQLDIQKLLREQLDTLEHRYQEKIDRIKKVGTKKGVQNKSSEKWS